MSGVSGVAGLDGSCVRCALALEVAFHPRLVGHDPVEAAIQVFMLQFTYPKASTRQPWLCFFLDMCSSLLCMLPSCLRTVPCPRYLSYQEIGRGRASAEGDVDRGFPR